MEVLIKCLLLSWMAGVSCRLFFETLAPLRRPESRAGHTASWAFTAAFLVIAFTEIPPYILQPVRFMVLVAFVAQIYYSIKIWKNLVFSLLLCAVYWLVNMLVLSVFLMFPGEWTTASDNAMEILTDGLFLAVMYAFHFRYRKLALWRTQEGRGMFALFPLCGMIVLMALSMISQDSHGGENAARLAALSAFGVVWMGVFYFFGNFLETERKLQEARLSQERIQNQMELYQSIQAQYEQQRRYLHDYKNQLQSIQGMLLDGQKEDALSYISRLVGGIRKSGDAVNTNHRVVNIVLNRKYQEACEKGIAVTMAVNDLSGLSMDEEDLVILLVNLLDNAIEACGKLETQRIIKLKLTLEEGWLILSIRNPVKEPLCIQGNVIATTKGDASRHGIGLRNVDAVIRKNKGTSVLACEEGWFSFSAMIPS